MILQHCDGCIQRPLEDVLPEQVETAELLQSSKSANVAERDVVRDVGAHEDLEDRVLQDREWALRPHGLDRLVAEALVLRWIADQVDRLVSAVEREVFAVGRL